MEIRHVKLREKWMHTKNIQGSSHSAPLGAHGIRTPWRRPSEEKTGIECHTGDGKEERKNRYPPSLYRIIRITYFASCFIYEAKTTSLERPIRISTNPFFYAHSRRVEEKVRTIQGAYAYRMLYVDVGACGCP